MSDSILLSLYPLALQNQREQTTWKADINRGLASCSVGGWGGKRPQSIWMAPGGFGPRGFSLLEGAGRAGARSSSRCLSSQPPWAVSKSRPLRGIITTTLEIVPLCPSPCIISNKAPRQPAGRAPWKTVASFEVRASVLFPVRFWFNDRCVPCQKRNLVMESDLSGYKYQLTADLQCRALPAEQAGLWFEPRRVQIWAQPLPQGARNSSSVSFSIAIRVAKTIKTWAQLWAKAFG